jgi:hypothetical protein
VCFYYRHVEQTNTGADSREMRELPPAKEEERYAQSIGFNGFDLSPQGLDLPRIGILCAVIPGLRTASVHEPILARPCRQRRLAGWFAAVAARATDGAVGGPALLSRVRPDQAVIEAAPRQTEVSMP